jgi:4-hydroxybenzoate polyprenyltransferase
MGFAGWVSLAVIGSYLLNQAIAIILIVAALLEILYCRLFKVTYLRVLVSGLVKSSGPIAAIFLVDHSPDPRLMLLVFAWAFFWEIGGQNIPADWNDTVEDRRVNAQTIPIHFGFEKAGLIVFFVLCLTVIASMFLPIVSPLNLGLPYLLMSALVGLILLLLPGYQLYSHRDDGRMAAKLFDHASYYPLVQLAVISLFVLIG